jgi:hypothetical protein
VAERVPFLAGRALRSDRLPWTMTPDADFAIGAMGPVTVAAGCSGHAFKFGPALGELVADTSDGTPRPAGAMYALDHPGAGRPRPGPVAPDHPLAGVRPRTDLLEKCSGRRSGSHPDWPTAASGGRGRAPATSSAASLRGDCPQPA